MNIHKEVLYDVEWQSLRVSLLGNFTTLNGVKRNIGCLRIYLSTPEVVRCWRVLNLLNAVRMGYHGQHLTNSIQDNEIILFRDHVQIFYRICKNDFPTTWNWNKVKEDLQELYCKDKETFEKIRVNLLLRHKNALKRKHKMDRDELKFFLNLMQKVEEEVGR